VQKQSLFQIVLLINWISFYHDLTLFLTAEISQECKSFDSIPSSQFMVFKEKGQDSRDRFLKNGYLKLFQIEMVQNLTKLITLVKN